MDLVPGKTWTRVGNVGTETSGGGVCKIRGSGQRKVTKSEDGRPGS